MQATWEGFVDPAVDLRFVVADAEVAADDLFVLEQVLAFDEVIQVHVSIFVDLVFAVIWGQEGHFGDQDFGAKHIGITVESCRCGIACVGDKRDSGFGGHLEARETRVSDLVSGPVGEFGFEFAAFFPDDETQCGDRVLHRMGRHDEFSGQFDFLVFSKRNKVAGHPPSVESCEDFEHLIHGGHRVIGQIERGPFHFHHPPSSDVGGDCGDMVEVRVANEGPWKGHKVPGLGSKVESYFQFGYTPVRLDGSSGVAVDGQSIVMEFKGRGIIDRTDGVGYGVLLDSLGCMVHCGSFNGYGWWLKSTSMRS